MALLVDTGVIYALADADDRWHERCRDYLAGSDQLLLAPITVIPEAAYLIRTRLGARAERAFATSLVKGEIAIEGVTQKDLQRARSLLDQYPDIGLVDASVVAVAERLRLDAIATTDRRHFTQIRPAHRSAFDLVP